MIVAVVVRGAGLGWFVRSARIQSEAVAAIENTGCSVSYDWEWRDGNKIPGGKPWAPRWLVDLIGVDNFGHVTLVLHFHSSPATDAAIVELGRLLRIQQAILPDSLTDFGLAHLKGMTELSALGLNVTQVTDAGLAHLTGLNKLSDLDLRGTRVTDAGARELKQALPSLTIVL